MPSPFRSLLIPRRFVFRLLIVGPPEQFVKGFCNGKIVFLLRCIDRQLRHPISEDVLRVRLPHRVSVGVAVNPVPPAFKPRIPRFDGGLFTVVKRPLQTSNIRFFQRRQFPEDCLLYTSDAADDC